MPRFLIKILNVAWLVIIFIGVPAITHAQFGQWNITKAGTARLLIYGGLTLGLVANVASGLGFKKNKDKRLCWEWAAVFGGLLIVQYAYTNNYLNFNWLKEALQWVQARF